MNQDIYLYGEDTQFQWGDDKTAEIGRKGGIESGKVRRIKAERRKHFKNCLSGAVYEDFFEALEDEIKDFIEWRQLNKKKRPWQAPRLTKARQQLQTAKP